ncbi:MAG: TRL domain-containing protein, partial [Candidatus Acidiferrales bacterium]
MKRTANLFLTALAVSAFALGLAGCAGTAAITQPSAVLPSGGIYTFTVGGSQVLSDATPGKTGRACGTSILGLVGTGDTSVETAMKDGQITKPVFVTEELTDILGVIYVQVCT